MSFVDRYFSLSNNVDKETAANLEASGITASQEGETPEVRHSGCKLANLLARF